MPTCIYTKTDFENSTGEHILQNSLGARWTSDKIVCNDVQKHFGGTIDSALEKGLRPFRTFLNTGDGRKGTTPSMKAVKSMDGHEYNILPGGRPSLARPIIKSVDDKEGQRKVSIQVSKEDQLPWALHELRKLFPGVTFDGEKLAGLIEHTSGYLDSPLKISMQIGGADFFRGMCKAAFNLLGVVKPQFIFDKELDPIRNFILTGSGVSDSFIGWIQTETPIPLPRIGTSDHVIAIWRRDGYIDGVVQFFGHLPFMIRFAEGSVGEDFEVTYTVNPHRDSDPAESRIFPINPELLPKFEQCSHMPSPIIWNSYGARFSRIFAEFQSRALSTVVADVVNSVLGSKPSTHIITQDDVNQMHTKIMEFVVHLLNRNASHRLGDAADYRIDESVSQLPK